MTRRPQRDSGQAAVEAALTLPLVLFLILGTLQLFLMLQARLMAQYAVFKAVRAGSVHHGDCAAMKHAAIAALQPTLPNANGLSPTEAKDPTERFVRSFAQHKDNQYSTDGHTGPIVEMVRVRPLLSDFAGAEDLDFDQPGQLVRLETRMIYWYKMRIPFANWVISAMLLAHYGLQDYTMVNPTMVFEKNAKWVHANDNGQLPPGAWPGGPLGGRMSSWAGQGQYLFPIRVDFGMRMMTPAQSRYFNNAGCPL